MKTIYLSKLLLVAVVSIVYPQDTTFSNQAGDPSIRNNPKIFSAKGRLKIQASGHPLNLAAPNSIALKLDHSVPVSQVFSDQHEYYGEDFSARAHIAGSEVKVTPYTREGRDYVDIVPMGLGKIELNITAFFVDGGGVADRMIFDVVPPDKKPVSITVETIGPNEVGLKLIELHPKDRSQNRLFVTAKYEGITQQVHIPNQFASFSVKSASLASVVSVDPTGYLTGHHAGYALVETKYEGLSYVACVIVSESRNPYIDRMPCHDLLRQEERGY